MRRLRFSAEQIVTILRESNANPVTALHSINPGSASTKLRLANLVLLRAGYDASARSGGQKALTNG